MNDLVSIRNAINRAQDNTGMEEDKDVPVLMDWAVEADKKIDSYYNYVERIHVIEADECTAPLPCGTRVVVGVLMGDCGCDCGLLFNGGLSKTTAGKITSVDKGLIVIDAATNNVTISGIEYIVQNNKIVFNANFDEEKVTVKTLGYKLDDDGFPMINENHIEAIATYLEYKLMNRQRWGTGGPKFSIREIDYKFRMWQDEVRDARAIDNSVNSDQHDLLALLYNDPLTGFYQTTSLRHPGEGKEGIPYGYY